jgi:hypothetical protein
MAEHKFKIRQMVFYLPGRYVGASSNWPYQIMQRLPQSAGEYQHRIKSAYEEHERAASESELQAV